MRGDRERRLAVMRDPATGVFGTLALLIWGLLLTTAIASLGNEDALRALVVAATIARTAALVHAAAAPPARTDGLGAGFTPGSGAIAVAAVATIAAAILVAGPANGLAALAAGALVALATTHGRAPRSAGEPATRSARPSRSPRSRSAWRCSGRRTSAEYPPVRPLTAPPGPS